MNKRKRLVIPVLLGLVCMCLFPATSFAAENSQSMTLTLTVPDKPDENITAPKDADSLKDLPLPEGWSWKDAEVEVQPGKEITVIAVHKDGKEVEVKVTGTLVIIAEGTDTECDIAKENSASIHCNGVLDALISVEMDGTIVEPKNYTTKDGSTIVTFKKSYLDTLSVGKYTVTLNYEVGSVDSALEIKKTSTTTPTATSSTGTNGTGSNTGSTSSTIAGAKTGDPTNIVGYIMLALLSGCVCIFVCKTRKKES